ncbi:MAG: helix-turn-helix domain-containing protein [Caldilineaceae bacterium]
MIMFIEQRLADSPYIDTITQGQTVRAGSAIRPAEVCWHMVFVREHGNLHPIVVGPWTTAGIATWPAGGEVLWIKFKPGVFMPHLPFEHLLDRETVLPEGAGQTFWLKSSVWPFPTYATVETFINRLVRDEVLVCDPVVNTVLNDQPHDFAPRTVRHRFQRATGLTQKQIQQVARAQQAAALLQQGVSILDAVHEAGYYDQPHLTRALRQWVGYTPAQLLRGEVETAEAQTILQAG